MRPRAGTRLLSNDAFSRPQRGRTPVLQSVQDSLRADAASGALSVDADDRSVSAAGRRLPLSPVMDPEFLQRQQRWRGPKEKPQGLPVGRFRQLVHANIYAQMLAAPPRYCSITRARLPRSFLQPFRPVTNPFLKIAWWTPTGAVPEEYARDTDRADDDAVRQLSTGPIAWGVLNREVLTADPDTARERAALSRRFLVPKQWRSAKMPGGEAPVFREGMARAMADGMRNQAAAMLAGLAERSEAGGKYMLPLPEAAGEELPEHHTPSTIRRCVLYTDPAPPGSHMTKDGEWCHRGERQQKVPGPYATMRIGQMKYNAHTPVHNLRYLLGRERLDELRANSPLLRDNRFLMLASSKTDGPQRLLWKLQGFLARSFSTADPAADGDQESE